MLTYLNSALKLEDQVQNSKTKDKIKASTLGKMKQLLKGLYFQCHCFDDRRRIKSKNPGEMF